MNGEKNEWLRPHNIRGPHSWYCSASLLRGSRAQVGDFHRVRPLCEEGHLGSRGRGGRGYNEWTFLEHLYRPLPALVGNNRVYRGWGMLVGYYLPGNSPAPHPDHRAGGTTAHEEVAQSQFDPFPPGRWPGGAGNIFCQLKAVWRLLPPERCLGGANHVFLQHINVIPFLVNIFVPSPLRSLLSWSPVISCDNMRLSYVIICDHMVLCRRASVQRIFRREYEERDSPRTGEKYFTACPAVVWISSSVKPTENCFLCSKENTRWEEWRGSIWWSLIVGPLHWASWRDFVEQEPEWETNHKQVKVLKEIRP